MSDDILGELAATLEARKQADPTSSYVARLYAKGLDAILKKVGEEATETLLPPKAATANIWCAKPPISGFIPWSCWPIRIWGPRRS